MRSSTTAALAAKFSPSNDMEEEVAELLRAAGAHTGEAVEEAEEALALKVWLAIGYMCKTACQQFFDVWCTQNRFQVVQGSREHPVG